MKDFSVTEIFASVKCQFVRRCTHSETILSRLADDFIARYSTKQTPHPEFFKQDASLTQNQLIMYADQCVQVMKKFEFLSIGAAIIGSLTNATFRIVDFLSKQLYHHLRESSTSILKTAEQPLCPACCKLRQNQRLRSLREQLNMQNQNWQEQKVVKELVVRKGQKYDQEELLCQSLENLQVLNEQQIRKKLGKMQLDHDKRKKEILVAVEELTRANERVASYSRALQRSGKQISGKFNIKDYVFQLGRHFYHNISSLDVKIRHLRQSLSPVYHKEMQTQFPVVLQQTHNQILKNHKIQADRIKNILNDTLNQITIQQRKNLQLQQMNTLLQQKLQQAEIRRQHQKIQQKILSTQLTNNLASANNKILLLQSVLRKLKTKAKDQQISQPLAKEQQSLILEVGSIKDELIQERPIRACKTVTNTRQSFLFNPKLLMRFSGNKSISHELSQRIMELMPTAQEFFDQINQENHNRLTFNKVMEQIYVPVRKTHEKIKKNMFQKQSCTSGDKFQQIDKCISSDKDLPEIQMRHSREVSTIDKFNEKDMLQRSSQNNSRKDRKKLTKIDVGRYQMIRLSKHQQSAHVEPSQSVHQFLRKRPVDKFHAFGDLKNIQERVKFNSKKILSSLKSSCGLLTHKMMQNKQLIQNQFVQRLQMEKRKKLKKARNLSQENSYQLNEEYLQLRKSIDKMQYNQRPLLGERQKSLLINSIEGELRATLRSSVYRSDCGRVVLSLEQINYSTYFYSLLASIHLKSPVLYENIRRFMISLVPGLYDDENSVKDSLNCLIMAHRKCSSGSICSHLQVFLDKIKSW